jgi:hypothetical protein
MVEFLRHVKITHHDGSRVIDQEIVQLEIAVEYPPVEPGETLVHDRNRLDDAGEPLACGTVGPSFSAHHVEERTPGQER